MFQPSITPWWLPQSCSWPLSSQISISVSASRVASLSTYMFVISIIIIFYHGYSLQALYETDVPDPTPTGCLFSWLVSHVSTTYQDAMALFWTVSNVMTSYEGTDGKQCHECPLYTKKEKCWQPIPGLRLQLWSLQNPSFLETWRPLVSGKLSFDEWHWSLTWLVFLSLLWNNNWFSLL